MTSSFTTSSLSVGRQLTQSTRALDKASNRLSSGKRINSASDDAAGLAIANALTSQAAVRSVASQNVGYAQSASDIASSALGQISDISTRLSELAAQSANGTLSDEQRGALQAEYTALKDEAVRITETTEFNGVNVLSGSQTSYQVGITGGSESTLQTGGSSASSIVAGLPSDISSQAAAQSALDSLSTSQSQISQQQGQIGATSSRLSYADSINQESRINELAAASRIQDADIATEAANFTSSQLKVKAASFVSAQIADSERNKFSSLLGKIKA